MEAGQNLLGSQDGSETAIIIKTIDFSVVKFLKYYKMNDKIPETKCKLFFSENGVSFLNSALNLQLKSLP